MKVDKKEIKELIIRFANMKTKDLKEYLKEGECRGYSKLKKAELLDWVVDLVLEDFEYLKKLDEEEKMKQEQERLEKMMEEINERREELDKELEENERKHEEELEELEREIEDIEREMFDEYGAKDWDEYTKKTEEEYEEFDKMYEELNNTNNNALIIRIEDDEKPLLKKMFKDLSKLYHPDLQRDKKNKEINERMIRFINNFKDDAKRICE